MMFEPIINPFELVVNVFRVAVPLVAVAVPIVTAPILKVTAPLIAPAVLEVIVAVSVVAEPTTKEFGVAVTAVVVAGNAAGVSVSFPIEVPNVVSPS
jgi:hypothetical protein